MAKEALKDLGDVSAAEGATRAYISSSTPSGGAAVDPSPTLTTAHAGKIYSRLEELIITCRYAEARSSITKLFEKNPELAKMVLDGSFSGNTNKTTLLHISANTRDSNEFMNFLIEKGCDVNAKDYKDRTPLAYAVEGSYLGNIEFLLEKGADQRIADVNGYYPIHLASEICRGEETIEIVKKLLSKGAKLTAINKIGATPFHLAAKFGNLHALFAFFDFDEDTSKILLNAEDNSGNRPLHYAAFDDSGKAMKFLKEVGATYTQQGKAIVNKDLRSPYHLAEEYDPGGKASKAAKSRVAKKVYTKAFSDYLTEEETLDPTVKKIDFSSELEMISKELEDLKKEVDSRKIDSIIKDLINLRLKVEEEDEELTLISHEKTSPLVEVYSEAAGGGGAGTAPTSSESKLDVAIIGDGHTHD